MSNMNPGDRDKYFYRNRETRANFNDIFDDSNYRVNAKYTKTIDSYKQEMEKDAHEWRRNRPEHIKLLFDRFPPYYLYESSEDCLKLIIKGYRDSGKLVAATVSRRLEDNRERFIVYRDRDSVFNIKTDGLQKICHLADIKIKQIDFSDRL